METQTETKKFDIAKIATDLELNKPLINRNSLFVAAPFISYILIYIFQFSYLYHFNLPMNFISVDYPMVILFTLILSAFIFGLGSILLLVSSWVKVTNRKFPLITIITLLLGPIELVLLLDFLIARSLYFRGLLLAALFAVPLLVIMPPYFKRRRQEKHGTVIEQKARRIYESYFWELYKRSHPQDILFAVVVVLMILSASTLGSYYATYKTKYLVINTVPEKVVIGKYGENLIVTSFDRGKQLVNHDFSVIPSADPGLKYRLERIGPLYPDNRECLMTKINSFCIKALKDTLIK